MSSGMSGRYAVGVDFGGTSVKLALVDGTGGIRGRRKIPTCDIGDQTRWLDAVAGAVDAFVAEGDLKKSDLAGIGVGVPGFVDFARGFIHDLTNVPGWTAVELGSLLSKRTGLRAIVDNDVNAMALGECTFGAGKGYRDAVFATLGTGVGGGLLIDGKLYRGAYSMAGEIGHVSIDMNGIKSPQGIGGLEQYVGNRRIVERTIAALASGRKSLIDELCKGDRSTLSPKTVKDAADRGDELALEILGFVADCIATAFASITYVIQPQAFIVGGGVAEEAQLLFDLMRKHLARRLSPYFAERIKIVPASLGSDAGVIGCASLALV